MNNLLKELQKEQQRLINLSCKLKEMQNMFPDGSLNISKSHGVYQFQRYYSLKEKKKQYISSKNTDLITSLAQKDYYQRVSSIVDAELALVDKLINVYQGKNEEKAYENLSAIRKKFVVPTTIPLDKYIKTWQDRVYQGKSFDEDAAEIITERGERVRSKSEKIIADKLYSMNIPYRYEMPLVLNGYGTVYPDFCILNKNTREEIYWEHFGIMDNADYCNKALKKIDLYIRNEIMPGEKLIVTFETSEKTLDTRVIQKIITGQLL